ncbi:hypothetical protein QKU48_gp0988 [Fadolivirus algeromassiliense]|jgi:hypothetical protein|uniref:Uncharacterized protein n=1 Tax=Fadolivirus FV1/VV64 TaxID=3070911 RepID=A0A7D3QWE2_9VIRU|nr:hypothetical protein QKU48_gp0988 [Fadolivirus algeromassiliense]QKF94446.1 hypothetical protein Fadolivirus_1_988 [Fadolivirus FV1/VV64]
MTTVYLYRVHCIEEDKDVTIWSTTTPNLCPNNHSDRSIDPSRTVVIDSIKQDSVKAEEPTDGYFQCTSVPINVPASAMGSYYYQDYEWPMDILVWKTEINPKNNMLNDKISVIADPDKQIGVLTSVADVGSKVLHVSNTVTTNVIRGFEITLEYNGTICEMGRIIAIDRINGMITVENLPSIAFPINTLVKLNVYMVKDYYVDSSLTKICFGDKGFRGKILPANTKMRVKYYNSNGEEKNVCWRVEYYIQG